MKTNNKRLVTHDGSFHTDDVFACATLFLMLQKKGETSEVFRTRDEEMIKEADYVFDVGGVYDDEKNRFDHHQKDGAGRRSFGGVEIEYASFGLVWKKFGLELCGNQKAFDLIDNKLAAPIDAWDNGFSLVDNKYPSVSPYFLQHILFSMEPTWREEESRASVDGARHDFAKSNIDEIFLKCVDLAKNILSREIIQAQDSLLAEEKVISIYNDTKDKRIIILDKTYPFQHTINNFAEPLFVVYPRKTNGWWGVKAVSQDPKTFNNRKNFPNSWGGLREEELVKITGVDEAVFCHKGLYMAVAKTKEGAIKLAQIAVES